jgi:putative oxidoreductase
VTTGFMYVEKSFEIIGGALLLLDLYVPLGLAILAPIVVSILLFHLLMERNTLVIGVVQFLLRFVLAWAYRRQFAPLLVRRADF